MRRIAAVLALAATAAAGCGGSAPAPLEQQAPDAERAQDLVPLTTTQTAQQADRIALVVSRGSRVFEGAPGTPFTRTRFGVERVLKGSLPREIVVQVIGGRLGDRIVPSLVPAFEPSRRYLLFLGPDGPAGPTIFPQAVFTGRRLDSALRSVQRYLRTAGGSR
jgi:hypothetical protein